MNVTLRVGNAASIGYHTPMMIKWHQSEAPYNWLFRPCKTWLELPVAQAQGPLSGWFTFKIQHDRAAKQYPNVGIHPFTAIHVPVLRNPPTLCQFMPWSRQWRFRSLQPSIDSNSCSSTFTAVLVRSGSCFYNWSQLPPIMHSASKFSTFDQPTQLCRFITTFSCPQIHISHYHATLH